MSEKNKHSLNPFHLLSSSLRENQVWSQPSELSQIFESIRKTQSGNIWRHLQGGHKWLDYFPVYDREFIRLKYKGGPPTVLEIGVYRGASLLLWKKYFGEDSTIVGVDINPECACLQSPDQKIYVEIGSQADEQFLKAVAEKHGPFDLIIDDGSHVASHQIASFNALFESGLSEDGLYFVEDLECMYWGHKDVYRDQPITSVDFFKMLIDAQNSVFSAYQYDDFALYGDRAKDNFLVSKIATLVSSIRFYRGLAVIEKGVLNPPRVLHM